MRDVLTTLTADPAYPQLAYAQVYAFNRNARFVTENGRLPESSIKVKRYRQELSALVLISVSQNVC